MQLTSCQKDGKDKLLAFLLSGDKELIISGPAGVGKTYLISDLLNSMEEVNNMLLLLGSKKINTVAVTATTNKAASILAESLGQEVNTIHSFLGLTVYNDFATGKTRLKKSKNYAIIENSVIFVDECSMINRELYKAINDSTLNCKIVYVGDHCQLSPVLEPISPVFDTLDSAAVLTTPVRNAEQPALKDLCNQFRDTVLTENFNPIQPVSGVIEYLDDDAMQEYLSNNFSSPVSNKRILCYSNNRVHQFNEHIRELRGLPAKYQEGEILVSNSAAFALNKSNRLSIEQMVTVEHSGDSYLDETMLEYGYELSVYKIRTNAGTYVQADSYQRLDQLIKLTAKNKEWMPMFYLKEMIADLRPFDGATVYKAQGSTYDEVVIDLGDIGACNNADQVARMLYVAISRAKSKVYLFGSLPEKYE